MATFQEYLDKGYTELVLIRSAVTVEIGEWVQESGYDFEVNHRMKKVLTGKNKFNYEFNSKTS